MLPAFFIIGIILSLILLLKNSRSFGSARYLAVFFLLISLYGFIQYAVLYANSVYLFSLAFVNLGTPTYLIGPVFLFYIRSLLSDDSRLKRTDLLHLIPMLIYFAGTFSYLIMPWSIKMEVAARIKEGYAFYELLNDVVLYRFFSKKAVFLSRPILVLVYTLWSGILIANYLKGKKEILIFAKQRFMVKWLVMLYGSFLVLIISHILILVQVVTIKSTVVLYSLNILQILSAAGLAGMLISPFFFPEVLYGLPRVPALADSSSLAKAGEPIRPMEKRISENRYERDYLELINEKTVSCMSDFQPYLQSGFNLAQLSVLIKTPIHHLAYYFKEVKKQSFSDFRNEWRVQHAKQLIADGRSANLTLEAIGLLSGFSSRNTFLTAFKKVEGVSPQTFLSQIKKGEIS